MTSRASGECRAHISKPPLAPDTATRRRSRGRRSPRPRDWIARVPHTPINTCGGTATIHPLHQCRKAPMSSALVAVRGHSPSFRRAMPAPAYGEATRDPQGCALSVVARVERALLRALASVLFQLRREHAKYCAMSVVRGFAALQEQLPAAAAQSLDHAAATVAALSDAALTDYWLSLVGHEWGSGSEVSSPDSDAGRQHEEQHVVARLFQSFLSLFAGQSTAHQRRTLTPCTSPVDTMDATRRPLPADDRDAASDVCEPGWAVEYMEQAVTLPPAVTRRMAAMMHSTVPTNLFRAEVSFSGESDEYEVGLGPDGLVGAITPGSLPPTPATRDLQARHLHHYTVSVLDHATLALQGLEAN